MKGRIFLIIAGLALAITSTAGAQTYSVSMLYTLPLQVGLDQPMPSGLDEPMFWGISANQTVGYGTDSSNNAHALLWSVSGAVDLTPSGYGSSEARGAADGQQVGGAYNSATGNENAFLWNGSAASAQDLNPAGAVSSAAFGTNGTQQVGESNFEAVLWNGTASSAVNLAPTSLSGEVGSIAYATDGTQQVGEGTLPGGVENLGMTHALIWSGTAASAVDLNPATISGVDESVALGVCGNQQVGYGDIAPTDFPGEVSLSHALLWTGTAASAVDLTPSWAYQAESLATNSEQQVGWSDLSGEDVATLWSGTAASAVNLQSLLPSSYNWISSEALAIDSSGDIFGYAQSGLRGYPYDYAVEWTVVPEPASASLALLAGAAILMRRRANHSAGPKAISRNG